MFRHRRRNVPGLNTTSTADISFMLLIFFLVTTSMNRDKGISRVLPSSDDMKKEQPASIDKNSLMNLEITSDNKFLVNQKVSDIDLLEQRLQRFILANRKKHIIVINADPHSTYDMYFKVQNQIVNAYKNVRDFYAKKYFGYPYAKCTKEEKERVRVAVPLRIAENYQIIDERGKP